MCSWSLLQRLTVRVSVGLHQIGTDGAQENVPQGPVQVDATGGNSLFMGSKASDAKGEINNNYGRPEGQNVGNFLTDRNSSRVLAPPGESSFPSLLLHHANALAGTAMGGSLL